MTHTERFAPSPTGPLHLGHAFSALKAWDKACAEGGQFLLRIEDIDQSRARNEWEQQIFEDLHWLGIKWQEPVLRQSKRHQVYRQALQQLWDREILYPCICTRKDIEAAISAPQEGVPTHGADGVIYPGTCRRNWSIRPTQMPKNVTLRLDMSLAGRLCGKPHNLSFEENSGTKPRQVKFNAGALCSEIGDFVLARRDMGTSYHLSVVLDDAFQNVTHVTRGKDLFEATKIHVLLQRLLGLPTPKYHHHRLIRDTNGKRLAKRDDARAIAKYRADGATPKDIRKMVGL